MASQDEIDREERAIYVVIMLAGLPAVIAAYIHGGRLDAGNTIALGLVVIALGGLLAVAHRHALRRA